jgi:predicted translin family RNA/ssDNA-binding protein
MHKGDKDEAKKTETEITNNLQKLKENTQKTKSKRVTRTPPKTESMDQVHR